MDARIRGEVSKVQKDTTDREYLILEDIHKSLGYKPCRLVDVGCGPRGLTGRGGRLAALRANSLGVDIDREALASNANVTYRVCANCCSLPLKSNSVDIVVCRWMLEHIETPAQVMREFARVLKKGGFLYIKTPNLWNYAMALSWVSPMAFHNFCRSARGMGDNTRTFYRANTKRTLRALARDSGFAVRRLESHSYSFMYYTFNKELFLVMRGLSRSVGRVTDRLQQTLLCVLEKVQDG